MFTKKTRIVSLLVTIAMLISLVAGFNIVVTANSGDATPIDDASDFASIALNGNYILTADIDFQNGLYTPIGTLDAPFTGTFDGDGHTISNLTLASDDNFQGLFGVNKGTIRNVKMDESCTISGNAYVGAIAGKNYGVVENCISQATVSYLKSSNAGGTYKVMTQNLCQWGDSEFASYDTYLESGDQLSRRPGMLARIKEVSPDLIAFQENSFTNTNTVSNDASWWENLTGKNTNTVTAWKTVLENDTDLKSTYTFFGSQGSEESNPQEGATVAYRTDKFTRIASGTFWHSTNPDEPIDEQDANWETWGYDENNRRVCNWVVLQDKSDEGAHPQKIVLYSLHLQDSQSEPKRDQEVQVLLEKISALREAHADAIFIAAGDYNESASGTAYKLVEDYLNGEMDNARNIATNYVGDSKTLNTQGDIYVGATGTIDHILIDGSAANVTSFEVRDELYDSLGTKYAASEIKTNAESAYTGASDTVITRETALRPSDHNGVVATFEVRTNYAIGGVVGENDGKVCQIVAEGDIAATDPAANEAGTAIGVNNKTAVAVFGTETVIGAGSTVGAGALTPKPSLEIVYKLNKAAETDAFALVEKEYEIIGSNDDYETPICITVNGVPYYTLPNSGNFDLDLTGIKDPTLIQDGKILEGTTSIEVGDQDMTVAVADSIMNVTEMATTGVNDFIIDNQDELEYADSKLSYINKANVTLYLGADIDLTDTTFDGFSGNILFSFDGMGKTIRNWTTNAKAFFHGSNNNTGFRGKFVKNVTFDNVHTGGGYGRSIVISIGAGANDLLMENVHVKNSSVTITTTENLAAILYTNTDAAAEARTVTIRGCSVVDSLIQVKEGVTKDGGHTNSGAVSGRIGNGVTYNISDIYVKGFQNLVGLETTGSKGNSVLIGTKESGATLTLNNIGVFDCSTSGQGYDLIGRHYAGTVNASNIITVGNTTAGLTAKEGGEITFSNVHTTAGTKIAVMDAGANDGVVIDGGNQTSANGVTNIAARADLKTGELAYSMNQALSNPYFYWEVDESNNDGALKPATSEQQTRKVTVKTKDTDTVYYADGGEIFDLPEAEDVTYCVVEGGGTVAGRILTVSTDMDTVVKTVDSAAIQIVADAIAAFEGKNLAYFVKGNEIAAEIETLKAGLKNGSYTDEAEAQAAVAALNTYGSAGYNTTPNAEGTNMPSVTEVEAYPGALGYIIHNEADWDHLETYVDYFNNDQIVIHLAADIDLSKITFECFDDPYFSFDGHGHTVSGWGTEANPARSNGMFRFNTSNETASMKFIKNLNLENCHTKYNNDASAASALLVTNECSDGGFAFLATDFTIDNVHVKDCSVVGIGNRNAIFMSAYANSLNAYTVTMKNCSIVGTTLTAGVHNNPKGAGHAGLLMGKANNNTGKTATYNFQNIYMSGNTMNAGRDNYDSLMIGNIEGTYSGGPVYNVTINMNNIVATDNVVNSLEANIGLVGNNDRGIVNVDGMILLNNDYKSSVAITSTSLFASNIASESQLTVEDVYTDEAVTANMQGASGCTVDTSPNAITSGEAAYGANAAATADSIFYYTTTEEGVELGTAANATRKIELVYNSKVVKTYYANGGESIELGVVEDPDATFSLAGGSSGSISGNVLTVPTDSSEITVTVTVTPSNASLFAAYASASVTTVESTVTSGDYTVANVEEWLYLYKNQNLFAGTDITIHIIADLDLAGLAASAFTSVDPYGRTSFTNPAFSLDGHGHTIKNWGTKDSRMATAGLIRIQDPSADCLKSIKNLTFENCHTTGSGGANTALIFTTWGGDAGYD